ncbi:MAG: DNA adenine methylase [Bacteroidales bacterium]|nr:DNA adenine methylase [Bacteroidales bacterium]
MTFIKSNLRWPGGKSKMMPFLEPFIPGRIDRYLEVFTGGGSVLLYMKQTRNIRTVYANDIDANLINYYNAVKYDPVGLIREIMTIKKTYTAETFTDVYKTIDVATPSGFFVSNKTSFSGLGNSYSNSTFDSNFSYNAIKSIYLISKVIKNVKFLNLNFVDLDSRIDDFQDFFVYLDPPYFSNRDVGLYGEHGNLHKGFDHDTLCSWVKAHADKNKIMLSYDDSEYIRSLYEGFNIYSFDFTYTMTNVGNKKCKVGKELVITNYSKPYQLF